MMNSKNNMFVPHPGHSISKSCGRGADMRSFRGPHFLCLGIVSLVVLAVPEDSYAQCQAGDRQLPATGLCTSEAARLMPPLSPRFGDGLAVFDCRPVINDAQAPGGDAILYHAAQCQGEPVALEMSGGAHSGSLTVLGGGMNEPGQPPEEIAIILTSDPSNPAANLELWARDSLSSDAEVARCKARRVPDTKDLWVVDEYDVNSQPTSSDGPRYACGTYGYTEDSRAYWRIAHGFAWFADFGQDAYQDFDLDTLTLVRNTGTGWAVVDDTSAVQQNASNAQPERAAVPTRPAAPTSPPAKPAEARQALEACQAEGPQIASRDSSEPVTITISVDPNVGNSARSVVVYWADQQGQLLEYGTLVPGQNINQETYAGHVWVAKDGAGQCQYFTANSGANSSFHIQY